MLERAILTQEEINALPLIEFKGEIVVVHEEKILERAVAELLQMDRIGFDTETKPSFRKGPKRAPDLIQFSGQNKAFLIQLRPLGIPDALKRLLESEQPTKVGLDIPQDILHLQMIRMFKPAGFYDLAAWAKKVSIPRTGLRYLCALLLKKRLSKKAQLTNWSNVQLSPLQRVYAATDAWVCVQMMHAIEAGVLNG